jgi:hypothetical protein
MSISTWVSRVRHCARGAALVLITAGVSLAEQPNIVGVLPTTPGLTYKTYDAREFYTFDSSTQFALAGFDLGRYVTSGTPGFGKTLDLPGGAAVEELTWYYINSGNGHITFDFLGVVLDGSSFADFGNASAAGVFPPEIQSITLRLDPPVTIDNSQAVYRLAVTFDAPGGQYQLLATRVGYRLQLSPAPAIASFLDVPTTDPFFQYIEALKASGITGGCGDGTNFCPNQPVLRKQMAAFLAKALGLNWP